MERRVQCSRAMRGRGFTFVELLLVLAIVAIGGALAVWSIGRTQNQIQIDRSIASLRAEVERVRALSRVAGSRLGARLRPAPECPTVPGENLLWISINPGTGQVIVPRSISYDESSDLLDVSCGPWNFGGPRAAEAGEVDFLFPTGPLVFGFTANGRVALPAAASPGTDVFIRFEHAGDGFRRPGFRVLPSGTTCVASVDDPVGVPCDEVRP